MDNRKFNYTLHYAHLDLRHQPDLYRVGVGEQGVLLVEPYKSEILPHWRFKTPEEAATSARKIVALFRRYRRQKDFIGMDMARKFLQMGYTRARRYVNHKGAKGDPIKARSAAIFKKAWNLAAKDPKYQEMKREWRERLG
jgi:hypothetical protein